MDEVIAKFQAQADKGKKWCYDCKYFYMDSFCGYNICTCSIYGSLDCDQVERHPDKTADTCKKYTSNGEPPWYL